MVALIEFYTRKDISKMTDEEMSREWAKLVHVLNWQSQKVNLTPQMLSNGNV